MNQAHLKTQNRSFLDKNHFSTFYSALFQHRQGIRLLFSLSLLTFSFFLLSCERNNAHKHKNAQEAFALLEKSDCFLLPENREQIEEMKEHFHLYTQGEESLNDYPYIVTLAQLKGTIPAACLKALLKEGADINAQDSYSGIPLHYAIENNHKEMIKLLLECNANVNAYNSRFVHRAIRNNDIELLKLLLEHQAEVNTKDADGWTPLYIAAIKNNINIAKLLIEYKADVNLKTTHGLTPLDYAKWENNQEMVNLLLEYPAVINPKN